MSATDDAHWLYDRIQGKFIANGEWTPADADEVWDELNERWDIEDHRPEFKCNHCHDTFETAFDLDYHWRYWKAQGSTSDMDAQTLDEQHRGTIQ